MKPLKAILLFSLGACALSLVSGCGDGGGPAADPATMVQSRDAQAKAMAAQHSQTDPAARGAKSADMAGKAHPATGTTG